ncbi:unnamed protein product [Lampetra fluviatilis]
MGLMLRADGHIRMLWRGGCWGSSDRPPLRPSSSPSSHTSSSLSRTLIPHLRLPTHAHVASRGASGVKASIAAAALKAAGLTKHSLMLVAMVAAIMARARHWARHGYRARGRVLGEAGFEVRGEARGEARGRILGEAGFERPKPLLAWMLEWVKGAPRVRREAGGHASPRSSARSQRTARAGGLGPSGKAAEEFVGLRG